MIAFVWMVSILQNTFPESHYFPKLSAHKPSSTTINTTTTITMTTIAATTTVIMNENVSMKL